MPKCKNDKTRSYKGTEPSPKGLGYCAHNIKVGEVKKGKDGNKWIVKEVKNGSKRWMKVKKENVKDNSIKKGKYIYLYFGNNIYLINIYNNTLSIYKSSIELGKYDYDISKYSDKVPKKLLKWTPSYKKNKPYYLSKLDKEAIQYFDKKIKEYKNIKKILISKELKATTIDGYTKNLLIQLKNNKYICILAQDNDLEINYFSTKNNEEIKEYYSYNVRLGNYHYIIGKEYVYLFSHSYLVPIKNFQSKIKKGCVLLNDENVDLDHVSYELKDPYIIKPNNISNHKAKQIKYYPKIPNLKFEIL